MDVDKLFPEVKVAQTMPTSLFPRTYMTEEQKRLARMQRIEAKRKEKVAEHKERRKTRLGKRARKHDLLMNPVGPQIPPMSAPEVSVSRPVPKNDRVTRKLRHARRRANPDYYTMWCRRMERYVRRRVHRRVKRVTKRIRQALVKARIQIT
jgi:hypothetical protein